MDNELKDLCDSIHHKTLQHRSIETVITSTKFERLWEESTLKQREEVSLLIQFGYKSRISEWMKHHPSLDLGEHSLNYLKERGRILKIKNYCRLSKPELIAAITAREEQDNEANKRRDGK
jgi:hypothetical protein